MNSLLSCKQVEAECLGSYQTNRGFRMFANSDLSDLVVGRTSNMRTCRPARPVDKVNKVDSGEVWIV